MLGLGTKLTGGRLPMASHVTDNLKMLHRYNTGSVAPVSDGAAYFDVSNTDWINVGGSATLRTANFSVSAWFKVTQDSIGVGTCIVTSIGGSSAYKGFSITKATNDKIEFRVSDGSAHNNSWSANAITADRWYHVVQTYDGSTQKAYINGVLDDSDSYGTYVVADTDLLIGGYYSSGALPMDGYICNVGYWSSALTQAQIKSIMWKNYAGLSDSEKTNLVSWWNLDEAVSQTSGGANRDTLVYDNHDTTLGNELLSNSDMTGTTGWRGYNLEGSDTSIPYDNNGEGHDEVANYTTFNGRNVLYMKNDAASEGPGSNQNFTTTVGKVYKFEMTVWVVSGTMKMTNNNDGFRDDMHVATSTTGQWETVTMVAAGEATDTSAEVYMWFHGGVGEGYVDSVSVKEYDGNVGNLL